MTKKFPNVQSQHWPTVVEQASCLPVAAEKLRGYFFKMFAEQDRLEACPTTQCHPHFEVRVQMRQDMRFDHSRFVILSSLGFSH
jgi:hypothetical protein